MTVAFQLTIDDVVSLTRYVFHRARLRFLILSLTISALCLVGYVWGIIKSNTPLEGAWEGLHILIFGVAGILTIWVLVPCVHVWLARRQYQKGRNHALWDKMEVAIDPTAYHVRSASVEYQLKWEAVEKIATFGGYLYIFGTTISALVIPNRAFATEEECKRFHDLVRVYHSKAMH